MARRVDRIFQANWSKNVQKIAAGTLFVTLVLPPSSVRNARATPPFFLDSVQFQVTAMDVFIIHWPSWGGFVNEIEKK